MFLKKIENGRLIIAVMIIGTLLVTAGWAWAAQEKPIVLKYADFTNPTVGYGAPPVYFMHQVEKRTNGRVKFQPFWSSTLVPANAITQAVSTGLADMGRIHGGNEAGKLPVLNLGSLPALGIKLWATCMAWDYMLRNSKAARAELKKYHLKNLFAFGTTEVDLDTTVKVTRLEDLKGLKIRAVGNQVHLLQALGGVPITAIGQEITVLLERGTIQGLIGAPSFVTSYGMANAIKYFVDIPFGSVTGSICMNINTWNRLPKDIQKIIEDVDREMPDVVAKSYIYYNKKGLDKMVAGGTQIIKVDEAEKEKVVDIARKSIWDKWVQDAPPGIDRREALDTFLKAYKKYAPKDPYQ